MKRSLLSISATALILTLSSGVVISKNFPTQEEVHIQTQAKVGTTHLAQFDALGDIGDEFITDCNATDNGKHPTCQQLWTGLGKIAANSLDGVQ